jgi:hypothetical protein
MQESGSVKTMTDDEAIRLARVTGTNQPKQAGDIHERWTWIEHSVWTERMLTRLEQSESTTVRWPNRWFAAQGLFSLEHGSCAYG